MSTNPVKQMFSKSKPVFQIKTLGKKRKEKKLWTQILENRERLNDIKINRKIEKTNIFMENPKARNKKESKSKSNLNLSNEKTQ